MSAQKSGITRNTCISRPYYAMIQFRRCCQAPYEYNENRHFLRPLLLVNKNEKYITVNPNRTVSLSKFSLIKLALRALTNKTFPPDFVLSFQS